MTLSMGNLFVLLFFFYVFGLLTTPLLLITLLKAPTHFEESDGVDTAVSFDG